MIYYKDPKIRGQVEDLRELTKREDVTWLSAPPWLKASWIKEDSEIEKSNFKVTKEPRKGLFVSNSNTSGYLSFMEGIRYRHFLTPL